MKTLLPPFSLAYKKRVYSPARIRYPMMRVDFDPNGERNPQNRGVSKYKHISWKEALDVIISEMNRIKEKYGPTALLYCLLYTSPSPRDRQKSRMPSSA